MEKTVYTYKTVKSGQDLAADVHYRRGTSPLPAPVGMGTTQSVGALVDLGFVVVSVNYRLCLTISLYDGPVVDCMDCYAWCKSSLPKMLHDGAGILVDSSCMAALGHSAGGGLALLMNPEPPLALLDFYGAKYFFDESWHTRNLKLPRVDFPRVIIDKVWLDVPPPSSFMTSKPGRLDSESPVDYSNPWLAWLASGLANGNLLSQIIPDGDSARNSASIFFIHGTEDKFIPVELTERAYSALKGIGVENELRLVEGEDHAFEEKLTIDDPKCAILTEGFEFLARHAIARI
ncbi:Alpha/Beta hydrolase protein [Leptodontidium sp. MPI-SDFR-AT-0119]|nr:Alpha/Beta hydrolase protein [Leptodontidium sp. MPI-SDFR-AT-0119]